VKKKELWLALSTLGVVASAATNGIAAPEHIGVVGKSNVSVEGQAPEHASRVMFVGSDVFRNETIRTDGSGLAHLLFLDQSSLTVGPNSELVLDHFIYDPETKQGELSLSAAKGVLRFVGGALSKKGNVTIKTPVGNLGIRGAVVLIDVQKDGGEVSGCFLYGNNLTGTTSGTNISKTVNSHEQCVILTPDGQIRTEPVSSDKLEQMLGALQGPPSATSSAGREVALPNNYSAWLRELTSQQAGDRILDIERFNDDALNRDIDYECS
jgi:hypothetical protein